MKNRVIGFVMAIIFVVIIGIFIYPGIYKYDKLNQNIPVKINRLTGQTMILTTTGWTDISTPNQSEINKIESEINSKFEIFKNNISDEIISRISSESIAEINKTSTDSINQINQKLYDVENEINAYKKEVTDPNNYFTMGSTKDEVKRIMGTPTEIIDLYVSVQWKYGNSVVEFTNGKVSSYRDFDNNLKIKLK